MKYTEYPGYKKTFILVHNTGFGVQEAPYKEQEIVYETDNEEDVYKKAEELKIQNNSPEAIQSSWCDNTYHVNINTLTDQGKEILKKFHDEFDKSLEELKKDPDYVHTIDSCGNNWHSTKHPIFDSEKESKGNPLQSHSFHIFDITKDTPNENN